MSNSRIIHQTVQRSLIAHQLFYGRFHRRAIGQFETKRPDFHTVTFRSHRHIRQKIIIGTAGVGINICAIRGKCVDHRPTNTPFAAGDNDILIF